MVSHHRLMQFLWPTALHRHLTTMESSDMEYVIGKGVFHTQVIYITL